MEVPRRLRRRSGTTSRPIKVPLMLVRGMADGTVVDDADEAELRRRQPTARVEHVEGAGHSIQGDKPRGARRAPHGLPGRLSVTEGVPSLEPIDDAGRFEATREAWHTRRRARARRRRGTARPATSGCARRRAASERRRTRARSATRSSSASKGRRADRRCATATRVASRSRRSPTLARAVGIEPGAPADVYTPSTPLDPDAPLVDRRRPPRNALGAWYDLLNGVLEQLPRRRGTRRRTLDRARSGPSTSTSPPISATRRTAGAARSVRRPATRPHPEPYLYVTHWADVPDDPFWSDPVFAGASLPYAELAAAADPHAARARLLPPGP